MEKICKGDYCCQHFIAADKTLEPAKLRYVDIHLESNALQWHKFYMKTHGATVVELSWSEYDWSITERFSDSFFKDAVDRSTKLYQIKPLQDYCRSFDALLNKVVICEQYVASIFLQGLIPFDSVPGQNISVEEFTWCILPRSVARGYKWCYGFIIQ